MQTRAQGRESTAKPSNTRSPAPQVVSLQSTASTCKLLNTVLAILLPTALAIAQHPVLADGLCHEAYN